MHIERAAERFRRAGGPLRTAEQGGGHLGPARHLRAAGGDRRALLRGLQRGALIHRRGEAGLGGVAAYALDRDNAERLWEVSLEMIAPV